jgi:hypothetical protein
MANTGPVGAQSSISPSEDTLSLSRLGLKGTAIFKNFSHFYETPNDRRNVRDEGILQVEWARRLAPWQSTKIVIEGRADDDGFANQLSFQVPEQNEHRSFLDLKEALLDFHRGPLTVTLGKQFFSWGTADGYNPTDNINPYDYMDPIDREKLAVYSAAAQLTARATSLTVVVVPLFTPSRSPLLSSRWVPAPQNLPQNLPAVSAERQLPARNLENVQYAARLRATVKGWDLSASYFEGFEHTAGARRTTVQVGAGGARVSPFARVRVGGFDFSTTYGKFEFHGETAFKFALRNSGDDRFQWVAGLNYTWDELDLRWLERIHTILEYSREHIIASDPDAPVVPLDVARALPDNGFRDAVIARILFRFNEETEAEMGGTVNFDGPANYYLKLGLTRKLTDTVQINAGINLFDGPDDTFWGRWRDNDRFFFFLKYFF